MVEAMRHNDGKIELSRIRGFGSAVRKVVSVMQQGAIKYADGNWLLGGKPDKEYIDSLDRHVQAYLDGEVYDKDSGNHHMAHAAWNCLALLRLNQDDMPEIDPDFDQAAFVARWSSAESPEESGLRDITSEEYLALEKGDVVYVKGDADVTTNGYQVVARVRDDPKLRVVTYRSEYLYEDEIMVVDG